MDIQLISSNVDSPVSSSIRDTAEKYAWPLQTHAPETANFEHLPECTFLIVVVDFSDPATHNLFVQWYAVRKRAFARIIKFIAFDTHYDPCKALSLAGLFDVEYTLLPDGTDAIYNYLYHASGSGDNFWQVARSLGSSVYSEIVDRYALTSVTDLNGVITHVNQNFIDVSGYSREELIGSKHNILKSRRHPPEFYADMWKTIRSGNCWRGDVCNRTKAGDFYWVDSFIFPLKDASGITRAYVSFRYDITQEVEARQRLMVRDERVRISHEYANVGTWDWDIDSGSLYWSEEIHKLFGYVEPVLETTYANFIQAIHPDDRELVISRVNESINYGTPYSVEHRVIHPNGDVRWLAERGHVMRDEKGKPTRMLGVVSDIHELIEAKKDAMDAEQIKSNFISTLSHEIRNPLNAAAGFSRIIAETAISEDAAQYAQKIETIIDHVSGILEDINLNNKLESGNIAHTRKAVSLKQIIGESVDIVLAKPTQITVEQQSIDGWVLADPQHLRQVIINLLSNAIKYNRKNGSVFIRTTPTDHSTIRIEVQDTGHGIAKNNLKKLFKPYERLKWKGSEIDGLGLGLPICKGLIENMAGTIGVSSLKDQGSTFWIELPQTFAPEQQTSAATNSNDIAELLPLSVLVLDDNEFNLEFMKAQLEGLGISVDTAVDGQEGLSRIDSKHYDLILTDINMPILDGRELIHNIQNSPCARTRKIPVIVITAGVLDQYECAALGASACLSKPIKKESLIAELSRVLNASQFNQENQPDPVIDETVLQHHLGNNPEKVSRLLGIFLQSLHSEIDHIRHHFEHKSWGPLGKVAHKLLSPAKSVGATRLANLLDILETSANAGNEQRLATLLNDIDGAFNATTEAVSALITANTPGTGAAGENSTQAQTLHPTDEGAFSVLAIDDDEFSIRQLQQVLEDFGSVELNAQTDPAQGLKLLEQREFDLLILDINMPNIDGIQFIRHLAELNRKPAIILYSSEIPVIHSASEIIASYDLTYVGAMEKPCSRLSISRLLRSYRKSHNTIIEKSSTLSDELIANCIAQERVILVYQPQISTGRHRATSVEALARLVDLDGTVIPPADFLSRLEHLGLETVFSSVVSNKAIMQLSQWQAQGIDIKMAINFSMHALEDIQLPDVLSRICEHYKVEKSRIIIEVTETALSARPKLASEVLVRLKLAGFTLSVDDFGTGYSSLEKLQKLPFTEIKLDRSYVSNATSDDISRALLTSSINLANQLRLSTVAEGVETQEDYDLAVKLGVDLIQGFYFSKPLLPDSFQSWLKEFHHGS